MRLRVLLGLAVGVASMTGCSGGGGTKRADATTSTTSPAERIASTKSTGLSDFCHRLTDLTTATGQVGLQTQLAQVKSKLAATARQANDDMLAGVPAGSGLFAQLLALDHDMQAVNAWVQTKATQTDLDQNRQPPDVQASFNDLGVQFRALQAWSNKSCKAFGSGENS